MGVFLQEPIKVPHSSNRWMRREVGTRGRERIARRPLKLTTIVLSGREIVSGSFIPQHPHDGATLCWFELRTRMGPTASLRPPHHHHTSPGSGRPQAGSAKHGAEDVF